MPVSAEVPIIERVFGGGVDRSEGRDRSAVVADLRRTLGSMGAGAVWSADLGGFGGSGERAALASATRVAPRDIGNDVVLAAPSPLAAVLAHGGVPRGSVVSVGSSAPGGGGATSLLLTLLAAPRGAWAAAVGIPDLGILAAAEMGVDLSRLGIIPEPGSDLLQVLSVLADGVDMIATVPPASLPPARQRILASRLRQSGAVLLVAGRWPGADLAFTVQEVRWSGIGQGFGRLRDRELDVLVDGRHAGAALGATVTLALRAGRRAVTVEAPASQTLREAVDPAVGSGAVSAAAAATMQAEARAETG